MLLNKVLFLVMKYIIVDKLINFDEWFIKYNLVLLEIYQDMVLDINVTFINKINVDFKGFCEFVYENSSKT
jgi:hypothetical protein